MARKTNGSAARRRVGIREFARMWGKSHTAVRKAIATGRIPLEPDGTIDPDKAFASLRANTDPAQQRGRADPALVQARTATEVLKARERRLRVERLEAELVPLAVIAPTVAAAFGRVRERCQRFIADAAPVLASIADPDECEARLDEMIRDLLDDLAATEVTVRGEGGDHAG